MNADDSAAGTFTVGVFQDAAWAERGLRALLAHGFDPRSLSIVAKASPEAQALIRELLAAEPETLELRRIGAGVAAGPLVRVLQAGDGSPEAASLAGSLRRAGFQSHDGYIFETLTARGGVLVGVRSVPRAADALACLHAYGGGNAAIGVYPAGT